MDSPVLIEEEREANLATYLYWKTQKPVRFSFMFHSALLPFSVLKPVPVVLARKKGFATETLGVFAYHHDTKLRRDSEGKPSLRSH